MSLRRQSMRIVAVSSSAAVFGLASAAVAGAASAAPQPAMGLPGPVAKVVATTLTTVHNVIDPAAGTPSKPSKPSTPSKPSKPSKPSTPSKPSKPSQPSKPSKPATPSKPSKSTSDHRTCRQTITTSQEMTATPTAVYVASTLPHSQHHKTLHLKAQAGILHSHGRVEALGKPSLAHPSGLLPGGNSSNDEQDALIVLASVLAAGLAVSHFGVRRARVAPFG